MHKLSVQMILLLILLRFAFSFEFKAPSVSATPLTINTQSQYQITAQRQYTQSLFNTPWDTQLVPAGSNLTVLFPSEYTLSGTETCDTLLYSFSFVSGYGCVINTGTNEIIITNSITSDTAISDIMISLSGILNPSPAINTSPFILYIGNDNSADDSFSAVSLSPAELTNIVITFQPATVNTTGAMHVNIQPTNTLPVGSTIVIEFPFSITWARDVNQAHQLQIGGTLSCDAHSNNINQVGIDCSGLTSTRQVTITNIITSEITPNQSLQFSINDLFSPPTTEPGVDHLTVTTSINGDSIDTTSTAIITGLEAQTILDLAITSTSALMTVNSQTGLVFKWTLTDTITNEDYFYIDFPVGTTINYLTSISTFSLTNISYDSATGRIQFYQNTQSQTLNEGSVANITFLTFKAPPSTQPMTNITLWVMNNGYEKMKGAGDLQAQAKTYQMEVLTAQTTVNVQTHYLLNFNLADALQSSGYIVITVPTQLTISALAVTITGTSINSSPTVSLTNSTTITLTSLNTSSSQIPSQSVSINISGLTQPSSVKTVSSFGMTIYYSSAGYQVAGGSQNTTITTTPADIDSMTITQTSVVTYSSANLTISFTNVNQIENGGKIQVIIASQVSVPQSLSLCTITGININSCSVSSNTITITTNQIISASTSLSINIGQVTTPITTEPSSIFSINTYNSANQLIDNTHSNTTGSTTTMQTPSTITSISLVRSSTINYAVNTYTISFTQPQILTNNNTIIIITIPSQIELSSQTECSLSQESSCEIQNNTIIITMVSTEQQTQYSYSISLTNVRNPLSLEPTANAIQIKTKTRDGYDYSSGVDDQLITNSFVGSFVNVDYQFSNRQINGISNLNLQVQMHNNIIGFIVLELADDLDVDDGGFGCQTSQFNSICSVIRNATEVNIKIESDASIPTSFSLLLLSIVNPTFVASFYSFSTLKSYTQQNYQIDEETSTVQFSSKCDFPCKSCNQSTPSLCTECYSSSDNLTTKVLLLSTECVSDCGNGYFQNNNICEQCASPCIECSGSATSCTYCDSNSTNKFLHNASCQTSCPTFYYDDTSQIPHICLPCVSPCSTCTASDACDSCLDGHYFIPHENSCVLNCPSTTTIPNNTTKQCDNCSSICETCSGTVDDCTSCSSSAVLHNNTCLSECPGKLIIVGGQCVSCDAECDTCEGQTDNCTSCSSSFPYLFQSTCVADCPNLYYISANNTCEPCADLSIGCQDCNGIGNCSTCDSGLVFLDNQCHNSTPSGYINISGEAVPCEGDCLTCQNTVTNCTSCKNFSLHGNTCIETCPSGFISISQTCTQCQYPCSTCENSVTECTSCKLNSSLYLNEGTGSCVESSNCPAQTYANQTTRSCEDCVSPCMECNSVTQCSSCLSGYFYYGNSSDCLSSCPFGWVEVVDECQKCSSPCEDCENSTTTCIDCETGFYLSSGSCLSSCPSGSLQNSLNMICVSCQSPCSTCENATDTCLSCQSSTYLHVSQCLSSCPDSYYGSSGQCKECENDCLTCSSAVVCLSCLYPLVLYNNQCISQCPSLMILNNDNQCVSCSSIINNCLNCNSTGHCLSCQSSYILFNATCYGSCPSGYVYSQTKGTCITVEENAEDELDRTLTSTSAFPMPFTIVGLVIFVACFMSKLQNKNTYLIGIAYSLFGILETASLGFMIWKYYSQNDYDEDFMLLFLITLGIIYVLNTFGLIVQTPLLLFDDKFKKWAQIPCNKAFFVIISIFSVLINYKLKLFIFTKLFSFVCVRAQLQNIQKFRIFNLLSFLGLGHEGLLLYVGIIISITLDPGTQIFFTFLDALAIAFLSIILAMAASHKDQEFFVQEDNGYLLNKKVMIEGDDHSKQAIKPSFLHGQENKHNMQSHDIIKEEDNEYYQDEEFSLSISVDNRSGIDFQPERDYKKGSLKKAYFMNDQSSNQIKKQTMQSQPHNDEENVKKSVIFEESENMYEEEDVIKKNKTMLIPKNLPKKEENEKKNAENGQDEKKKSSSRQVGKKIYKKKRLTTSEAQDDDIEAQIRKKQEELMGLKKDVNEKEQNRSRNRSREGEKKVYRKRYDSSEGENEDIETQIRRKQEELQDLKKQVNEKEGILERKRSRKSFSNDFLEEVPNTKPVGMIKKSNANKESERNEVFEEKKQSEKTFKQEEFKSNEKQTNILDELKEKSSPKKSQRMKSPFENRVQEFPSKQLYFQESQIEETSLVKKTDKEHEKDLYTNKLNAEMPQSQIREEISQSKMLESQNVSLQKKPENKSKISENISAIPEKQEKKNIKNIDKNESVKSIMEENQGLFEKKEDNSFIESSISSHANLVQGKQMEKNQKEKKNSSFFSDQVQEKKTPHKKRQPIQNVFDQYLDADYDESMGKKIEERPGEEESPEKRQNIVRKDFDFQQVDEDFEDYEKILKYQKHQQLDDSELDQSRPEYDQEINHRPMQASFTKSEKKQQQKEGLVNLLQNANKDKKVKLQGANNPKKIPSDSEEVERGRMRPSELQTARMNKPPIQRPSTSQKSRMYLAGLRQMQDATLTKKSSVGHPVDNRKSTSGYVEDSEEISDIQSKRENKKRNKSLYNVPFKKYNSKQISHDHIDQMEFRNTGFGNFAPSNDESFNERYTSYQSTTMQIQGINEPPMKPAIGGTARNSFNVGLNKRDGIYTRQNSRKKYKKSESKIEDGEDLQQYYGKQGRKSRQKYNFEEEFEKMEKSKSKSRSKSREKSKQDTKRMKQLEKIYLQRLTTPKR